SGSSGTSLSDDESSDDEEAPAKVGVISLDTSMLESLHALGSLEEKNVMKALDNAYVLARKRGCNLPKESVRNWHELMPHVASLKNAYRDRPPPRRRREDDDEEEPAEMKFFREKVMEWLLRRQYPEDSAKLADLEMWWYTTTARELGHVTSEKQSPSAIDFLATMQEAVQLEKRLASKTSSSKALKDLLNSSIAQYNKLVTKKEHRIDGRKKIMVYNLLRAPTGFHQTKTEKVEKSEGDVKMESKEEDSSMDSDADEDEEGDGEIKEDAEVRDGSVYGKRDGYLAGLAVTSSTKNNIFKNTKGWKSGAIHGVEMLPRGSMQKPPEVAGGTSIIHTSLESFLPKTVATVVLIDCHAYDAWPGLATLEAASQGTRMICGTICLDIGSEAITKKLASRIYEDARSGALELPNFPQFAPLVAAMKDDVKATSHREYHVCVQRQSALAILESYASKFMDSSVTKDEAVAAIEAHNEKYNPDGEFWVETARTGSGVL
ncbi:unnamed protein product, partial [Durusdinium trenchii]